jgi:cellobiose-specific phosphotransferase system component IIA
MKYIEKHPYYFLLKNSLHLEKLLVIPLLKLIQHSPRFEQLLIAQLLCHSEDFLMHIEGYFRFVLLPVRLLLYHCEDLLMHIEDYFQFV